MKHYCIYEWNNTTKKSRFIEEYDNYEDARTMADSYNNFREKKIICYKVRCLEDEEMNNKQKYDIFINKIIGVTIRK